MEPPANFLVQMTLYSLPVFFFLIHSQTIAICGSAELGRVLSPGTFCAIYCFVWETNIGITVYLCYVESSAVSSKVSPMRIS